jgi:single-stranded DNA-binding protein
VELVSFFSDVYPTWGNINKSSLVYIEKKIMTRSYKDNQGEKYSTEMIGETITFG